VSRLDAQLGAALARWIETVGRAPELVIALCVAGAVAALLLAWPRLGLNSDEDALFSSETPYAALRADFAAAFPSSLDPVIVLIEGDAPGAVDSAAERLEALLLRDPDHFPAVYDPEARTFFERRGLLYLETDELADVVDRLIEAQPLLAGFARDPSLRGLAGLLGNALEAPAGGERFDPWLDEITYSIEAVAAGERRPPDWSGVFGAKRPARESRRYLLVQPMVDHGRLEPAAETLIALREVLRELGLDGGGPVRARVTGLYPLSYEEAHLVERQVRLAGIASFLLVAGVLWFGVRSLRQVAFVMITLVVGLAYTAAFAGLAVGHLNLISVAFGVLFIGLSVDFGIHLLLRHRELTDQGRPYAEALAETARSVGGSLVVCAVSTAIAFFAFVPSAFLGVAELGLIAGFGMFISLFANLTLLPALLMLGADPVPRRATRNLSPRRSASFGERRAGLVVALAALAGAAGCVVFPRIRFDLNPLRVRDPNAESVQAFDDLLATGHAFPWNLNVLAPSPAAARALAARLEALPTVASTLTLEDLIPSSQPEKLAFLQDAAFVLAPALAPAVREPPPSDGEALAALEALRARAIASRSKPAGKLARALSQFHERAVREPASALRDLRAVLVAPLVEELARLRAVLTGGAISRDTLPESVVAQRVARDGRLRIEVFPAEDLNDNAALERFVADVRSVDANAFGEGVVIYESGQIVVAAFRQALAAAAIAIALLLVLMWHSALDLAVVAVPIGLAALLTGAATVVFGVPLNFANIIVIPLLLGMGVDTGIHLVHRYRYDDGDTDLLNTSTARAAMFSALTTLASFGTLAFAAHRGMASLGQLLAIGLGLIVACNLLVLPSLAQLMGRAVGRMGRRAGHRHATLR